MSTHKHASRGAALAAALGAVPGAAVGAAMPADSMQERIRNVGLGLLGGAGGGAALRAGVVRARKPLGEAVAEIDDLAELKALLDAKIGAPPAPGMKAASWWPR